MVSERIFTHRSRMEYVLPKELSHHREISEKTVYNYLSRYSDKIRIKKEFWKTFVHAEDFTEVVQKVFRIRSKWLQRSTQKSVEKEVWMNSETILNVGAETKEQNQAKDERKDQEHKDYILAKNKDLEKQNTNLQDQLSKYALLLREEKNEKKELMSSYDDLQQMLRTKLEQFNQIQLNAQKKYSTLLVLCWCAVFAAGLMAVLYLIERQLI